MKAHSLIFSLLLTTLAQAEPLVIQSQNGQLDYDVEVANDAASRERGLMYRDHLAPQTGMLFVYPKVMPAAFWMKNTLISLDMLFIDVSGRIQHIHAEAEPRSLKIIQSPLPVLAVLEIPGGEAGRLNIRKGDRVIHPTFTGQQESPKSR